MNEKPKGRGWKKWHPPPAPGEYLTSRVKGPAAGDVEVQVKLRDNKTPASRVFWTKIESLGWFEMGDASIDWYRFRPKAKLWSKQDKAELSLIDAVMELKP